MDFGFSVTVVMDALGAGTIALEVTAAFFALGWLAFLTVFFTVDLTTFFTAGFFATGLTAFFAVDFTTVFLAAGFTAFLTAGFFFVSSFFFFVVAILASYKFQVSRIRLFTLKIYMDIKGSPASSGPCLQKFRLMFMRASFQDSIVHGLKTKNPSSTSGTKSSLRGTTQIRLSKQTLFVAVTGFPGADYLIHQRSRSCEQPGEFGLERSLGRWCWASTSLSQLADGMTYYSCFNFYFWRDNPALILCGPRGIRTLDLLNAIETRSQLRYGPI